MWAPWWGCVERKSILLRGEEGTGKSVCLNSVCPVCKGPHHPVWMDAQWACSQAVETQASPPRATRRVALALDNTGGPAAGMSLGWGHGGYSPREVAEIKPLPKELPVSGPEGLSPWDGKLLSQGTADF